MIVITGVGGWPASIPEQARAAEAQGFDCLNLRRNSTTTRSSS